MLSSFWIIGLMFSIIHVEGLVQGPMEKLIGYPFMRLCGDRVDKGHIFVEYTSKIPSSDVGQADFQNIRLKTEDIIMALAELEATNHRDSAMQDLSEFLAFDKAAGFKINYVVVDTVRARDGSSLDHWTRNSSSHFYCFKSLAPEPAQLINQICTQKISQILFPEAHTLPSSSKGPSGERMQEEDQHGLNLSKDMDLKSLKVGETQNSDNIIEPAPINHES
ncbi:uncharacterized protein PGTG_17241 [Puccinia graminis f. sp. tritici CRL 75-36-700-3]|uniref:Uncharacterized protein n=1 Tax=Puccinia graminis f. sp. tritici (strain CRL 75-36-700-3 / race SCCL) TaxID=418459 RepID=E3L344_PUCGT|nr:uncharacterized protein PGTG_17241 [Puccinia graminis f. sp. tritici CRL 75-36-700-3]EFP90969.2 hypothetical protein PGTG_17241 [Puccinia graminis f. sp. tritici CRL 75-36-700-3]